MHIRRHLIWVAALLLCGLLAGRLATQYEPVSREAARPYLVISPDELPEQIAAAVAQSQAVLIVFAPTPGGGEDAAVKEFRSDYEGRIRELARRLGDRAAILWIEVSGEDGKAYQLAQTYGVYTLPSLVVLDGAGNPVDKFVGSVQYEDVLTRVYESLSHR